MFCSDVPEETGEPSGSGLNNLDSALQELGMLSTITNSRNQYLQEMRRKSFGSRPNIYSRKIIPKPSDVEIVQMNTRYVSNVTIGLRIKRSTNNRAVPYVVPERNRTKSENSEGFNLDWRESADLHLPQDIWMDYASNYVSILDPKIGNTLTKAALPALRKARSLEDTRVENIDASQPSHEMEFVSSRIQKLKVME